MKALPRLNPSSENLGFFRFSEMDQGVEVKQRSITCNKTHNHFVNFGEWNPLRRLAETASVTFSAAV